MTRGRTYISLTHSEYCFNVTIWVSSRGGVGKGYRIWKLLPLHPPSGVWRGIKSQREMIYLAITRRRYSPPLAAHPLTRRVHAHRSNTIPTVSAWYQSHSNTITPRTQPVFSDCRIHYVTPPPLINSRFQIA